MSAINSLSPLTPLYFEESNQEAVKAFSEKLEQLNASFKQFDRVPDDKQNFTKDLESAFQSVQKVGPSFFEKVSNLNPISDLFYLLGRVHYGDNNFEKARLCFQTSLLLRFASYGMVKSDFLAPLFKCDTLFDFIEKMPSYSMLKGLPEDILTSVGKEALLKGSAVTNQDLFDISCNLRWLGHACQNIEIFQHLDRFKLIYGWAQDINQELIDHPDHSESLKNAAWEMAELLYHTERFLLDLSKPSERESKSHILAKLKTLENIKPYLKIEGETLRARQKLAQIENIQAMEKRNLKDSSLVNEYMEHSKMAVQIAEKTENFDPSLLKMLRTNYLSFSIELAMQKNDLKSALQLMKELQNL